MAPQSELGILSQRRSGRSAPNYPHSVVVRDRLTGIPIIVAAPAAAVAVTNCGSQHHESVPWVVGGDGCKCVLWPRQAGEGGQEASSAEVEKPVDAIASETLTKTAVGSRGTLHLAQSSSQDCVRPRYAAFSINSASFSFKYASTAAMALI